MKTRSIKLYTLAAALAGGMVFQLFPTGCAPTLGTLGVRSFNFCAVLNCNENTFFDLCNPAAPILLDCP
ncbi:MAG: hypothetical protein ACKVS9_01700 [Phycisphaerae bacterium]